MQLVSVLALAVSFGVAATAHVADSRCMTTCLQVVTAQAGCTPLANGCVCTTQSVFDAFSCCLQAACNADGQAAADTSSYMRLVCTQQSNLVSFDKPAACPADEQASLENKVQDRLWQNGDLVDSKLPAASIAGIVLGCLGGLFCILVPLTVFAVRWMRDSRSRKEMQRAEQGQAKRVILCRPGQVAVVNNSGYASGEDAADAWSQISLDDKKEAPAPAAGASAGR